MKYMAAVLFVFSCNFHLVKYLCKTVMACVRHRTMVSGLQDWVNRAVSSAYRASWVWGGWGMSEMYMAKSVVDSTAPCGRPDGVVLRMEEVSFRRTVKERSVRNDLRI